MDPKTVFDQTFWLVSAEAIVWHLPRVDKQDYTNLKPTQHKDNPRTHYDTDSTASVTTTLSLPDHSLWK